MGLRRVVREWGSSPQERGRPHPCDEHFPDPQDALFRAVSIDAEPAVVFRWLCQLRVAPYSYDWIDNRGRRSPQRLTSGLDEFALGQPVMQIFELVAFQNGHSLTLRLRRPREWLDLAVSYEVTPETEGRSRLLVKLLLRYGDGPRGRILEATLPTLDWIMMRRQLLNLKRLAETPA
jgi:hypothetical protein